MLGPSRSYLKIHEVPTTDILPVVFGSRLRRLRVIRVTYLFGFFELTDSSLLSTPLVCFFLSHSF